jgi:hypothetical protein
MPAIDLARLKTKSIRLAEKFDRPADFLYDLHDLLEFYADRTIRLGKIAPISVLPTYRVPPQILRQIEIELSRPANEYPEQALALCDALWKDGYLEMRLLAAKVLSHVPPRTPRLIEHLTAWVEESRDPDVRSALLTNSPTRMRNETPDIFIQLIGMWMDPAREAMWANGVTALLPLLEGGHFENLPPIFEIARPLLDTAPPKLQIEITQLLNALFHTSPTETTFYLREVLMMSQNRQTIITLRRISHALPVQFQEVIREFTRQQK